jgi:hypothetical protein
MQWAIEKKIKGQTMQTKDWASGIPLKQRENTCVAEGQAVSVPLVLYYKQ